MKILLPVDGSMYSHLVVDFVSSRTSLLGKKPEIELLNVQTPPGFYQKLFGAEKYQKTAEAEGEKVVAPIQRQFADAGLQTTAKTLIGRADEVIAQEAAEFGPDLIIMGSRGLSPYQGLIMGSVTTGVLAQTRAPMLLLRGKAAPGKDDLLVGIAVDGSEYGAAAARYVTEHRDLFGPGAEFIAFNVVSDMNSAEYSVVASLNDSKLTREDFERLAKEDFESAMETVRPIFKEAGMNVKEVMLEGDPQDEITDFAIGKQLDLLVMGSHGYNTFRSAVIGSVAMHVAAEGNVPLLLVKTDKDDGLNL